MTTEEVYRRHVAAFSSGDLDAVLADYADDAVIHTQNGIIRGEAEIRSLFAFLLQSVPPGTDITIDTESIDGDVVYVVWHVAGGEMPLPFVTDTHVIKEGKIVVQTFAAYLPTQ